MVASFFDDGTGGGGGGSGVDYSWTPFTTFTLAEATTLNSDGALTALDVTNAASGRYVATIDGTVAGNHTPDSSKRWDCQVAMDAWEAKSDAKNWALQIKVTFHAAPTSSTGSFPFVGFYLWIGSSVQCYSLRFYHRSAGSDCTQVGQYNLGHAGPNENVAPNYPTDYLIGEFALAPDLAPATYYGRYGFYSIEGGEIAHDRMGTNFVAVDADELEAGNIGLYAECGAKEVGGSSANDLDFTVEWRLIQRQAVL